MNQRFVRQLHQHVHDRLLEFVERRVTRRAGPADAAAEQGVAGEHRVVVDQERELSNRVPRDVERADVEVAAA